VIGDARSPRNGGKPMSDFAEANLKTLVDARSYGRGLGYVEHGL
jgi:hypothetical protein